VRESANACRNDWSRGKVPIRETQRAGAGGDHRTDSDQRVKKENFRRRTISLKKKFHEVQGIYRRGNRDEDAKGGNGGPN